MNVKIIGCGDAFGSGGRFNSATLVESSAGVCLLDCGASTMIALNLQAIDPNRIDTIAITHLHGDHFGGIPFFLLDAQWIRNRKESLLITGPPGTKQRMREALEILFAGTFDKTPWSFSWRVEEIMPGRKTDLGGFSITTAIVDHDCGAPATAIRLEDEGRIFVHSGDTKWTDQLISIGKGADLLFLDCFTFDQPAFPHMSYQLLLQKRSQFDAKRVVLTHMGPQMLANRHRVDTRLFDLADDGREYSL